MRTNTPLHALTLLNDVGMLEAASAIASSAIAASPAGDDIDQRLEAIFKRILSRVPEAAELDTMRESYHQSIGFYLQSIGEAKFLVTIGQAKPGPVSFDDRTLSETASLMIVASLVMNLDEAITHE
jgi:hypothetical protein